MECHAWATSESNDFSLYGLDAGDGSPCRETTTLKAD